VKYLLMIYNNPAQLAEEDFDALLSGHKTLFNELNAAGKVVSSAALPEPSVVNTKTVHIVEGNVPAVTDGPFLEAKEYLAGYYLVDCETVEEAVEIARRVPCSVSGAVEIRPINEDVTRAVRGDA
jgi:hypothetical protein